MVKYWTLLKPSKLKSLCRLILIWIRIGFLIVFQCLSPQMWDKIIQQKYLSSWIVIVFEIQTWLCAFVCFIRKRNNRIYSMLYLLLKHFSTLLEQRYILLLVFSLHEKKKKRVFINELFILEKHHGIPSGRNNL